VNDLAFTGCVNAAVLLSRTSVDLVQDPKAEHPIQTDGDVAVIRLNDCTHPDLMAGAGETSSPRRGRLARALPAFRDDVVRSNIFFTTYNTLRLVAKRKAAPTAARTRFPHDESRGLDWLTPLVPVQRSFSAVPSGSTPVAIAPALIQ
jgi:hypothetical protein